MSVMIEIVDPTIQTRSGVAKDTGKAYTIREQVGYVHLGEQYPAKIVVNLPDNHSGWPCGWYELGGGSYQVGRFGALELSRRLALVPCERPASQRGSKAA